MKKLLAATAIAFLPAIAFAATPPDIASLKAYATQELARCPDQKLTIERVDKDGPLGFMPYLVTQTSSDTTCGRQTTLLYSPQTRQILMGSVFDLPVDMRSVGALPRRRHARQSADAAVQNAHRFARDPERRPPRQSEGEVADHRALRLRVPDVPPRAHGARADRGEAPVEGRLHPPRPPALRAPRVGRARGVGRARAREGGAEGVLEVRELRVREPGGDREAEVRRRDPRVLPGPRHQLARRGEDLPLAGRARRAARAGLARVRHRHQLDADVHRERPGDGLRAEGSVHDQGGEGRVGGEVSLIPSPCRATTPAIFASSRTTTP